jgi:hypothetical protein
MTFAHVLFPNSSNGQLEYTFAVSLLSDYTIQRFLFVAQRY